jgi:cobalamin biosynthesis Co2+ chelatase CbiK
LYPQNRQNTRKLRLKFSRVRKTCRVIKSRRICPEPTAQKEKGRFDLFFQSSYAQEMHDALLIISHGSRRAASNEETAALAGRIRERSGGLRVAYAFLELAEPTVQQAADQLVESGATGILIFPHFLAAGRHVIEDIPREIETAQNRHPTTRFRLLAHLGALSELPALILKTVKTES